MENNLIWVLLVVGIATAYYGWSKGTEKKIHHPGLLGLALVLAAVLPILGSLGAGSLKDSPVVLNIASFAAAAVLSGLFAAFMSKRQESHKLLDAGGIALAGGLLWASRGLEGSEAYVPALSAALGVACGVGAVRFLYGSGGAGMAASMLGLVGIAGLGAFREEDPNMTMVVAMAAAPAIAALVAFGVQGVVKGKAEWAPKWLGVILAWVGLGFAAQQIGKSEPMMMAVSAGVVAALISALTVPEGGKKPLWHGVSAVIWLSAATFAFSEAQGWGMAGAAFAGTAVLVILGRTKLILALAPVLVLSLYRLVREAHPETVSAFDIGQHYAMIGVLLGIMVILALAEFLQNTKFRDCRKPVLSASAAALAGASALIGAGVILGPKGVIGLLIGVGLAPAVHLLSQGARTAVLTMSCAGGVLVALSLPVFQVMQELTRAEKQKFLIAAAIMTALLVGASWLLVRGSAENSNEA
jgi:hypothetical protein